MSLVNFHSFSDELEKIAVRLTQEEERRQALKFGLLGGLAIPATSAVHNLVQLGRIVPSWTTPKRWLASQAVGALGAGVALPLLQHHIARESQEGAKERLRRQRISETLKRVLPGGED